MSSTIKGWTLSAIAAVLLASAPVWAANGKPDAGVDDDSGDAPVSAPVIAPASESADAPVSAPAKAPAKAPKVDVAVNAPGALPELAQMVRACAHSNPTDMAVRINRGTDDSLGKLAVIHFDGQGAEITQGIPAKTALNQPLKSVIVTLFNEHKTLVVHAINLGQPATQHPSAACINALLTFAARSELESASQKPSTLAKQGASGRDDSGRPVEVPKALASLPAGPAAGAH